MSKIFIGLMFLLSFLVADEVALVKKVVGDVSIKRDSKIIKVKVGFELNEGDIVITKKNSSIGFIFKDGTIISLGENSIFKISDYEFEPVQKRFKFDVKMYKGLATFESGKIGKLAPKAVKFRVPEGIIGIRGTKFFVEVKER